MNDMKHTEGSPCNGCGNDENERGQCSRKDCKPFNEWRKTRRNRRLEVEKK